MVHSLLEGATVYVGVDNCKGAAYANYWVCDGTADDVQIQAAIDYVYALGGGSVHIARGTYTLANTVYLRAQVYVFGEGIYATYIVLADNVDDNVFEWSPATGGLFAGLFYMTVNGNGANNASGHCLFTTDADGGNCRDFHSSHVFYWNAAEDGVHCDYSWGYRFTDCLFEGNARDGLHNDGDQMSVLGFFASVNGRNGIYNLAGGDYLSLQGVASGNGNTGLHTKGRWTYGGIFTTGNQNDGVWIEGDGCALAIVSVDNSLAGASWYNLRVTGDDNYIAGNVSEGASVSADIRADGSHNWYWLRYRTISYAAAPASHIQIVNGAAINDGDPDAAGAWNGVVKEDGLVIRDITNNVTYLYDSREAGGRYTI